MPTIAPDTIRPVCPNASIRALWALWIVGAVTTEDLFAAWRTISPCVR